MPCSWTYLSLIPLHLSLHIVDTADIKAQFPAICDFSGHHLFISAFMLTSKVICDNTYFNKFWSIISQGIFSLREINQMKCEIYSYLKWQLNIDLSQLWDFESKVWQDFKRPGPYPNYVLSYLVSISVSICLWPSLPFTYYNSSKPAFLLSAAPLAINYLYPLSCLPPRLSVMIPT